MVLYGIILVPLEEELQAIGLGILTFFYVKDASFGGLAKKRALLVKLLLEPGPDWEYFPEPDKSLFIVDSPTQEVEVWQ